jgi:hypothetical protein
LEKQEFGIILYYAELNSALNLRQNFSRLSFSYLKEKEESRRAFAKLVGSDAGFESAWQSHLKANEALKAVVG